MNQSIRHNHCPGYWTPAQYLGQSSTMAPGILVCAFCKKDTFRSKRGLTQHLQTNPTYNKRMKLAVGVPEHRTGIAHDFMQTVTVNRTYGRQLTGGVAQTVGRIQQETRAMLPESPARARIISKNKQQSTPTSQQLTQWQLYQTSVASQTATLPYESVQAGQRCLPIGWKCPQQRARWWTNDEVPP